MVHVDDSNVVKPYGHKFEDIGMVSGGSKGSNSKSVYEKGYRVTEACAITKNNHPVSIYSKIHSSSQKNYTSANTITFEAMKREKDLFGKATFVMDRGYDDNKMFLKLDELDQDYVIRLTTRRKLFFHNNGFLLLSLETCVREN